VGKGAGFHAAIDGFLRYPEKCCRLVDIEDIPVFKLRGRRLDECGLLRLTSLAWWHGCVPCRKKFVVYPWQVLSVFAAVRGNQYHFDGKYQERQGVVLNKYLKKSLFKETKI
jgi:hypothetical protein